MIEHPMPFKPSLRGVWHQWAAILSLPLGAALVLVADGARAQIAVAIYAISLVALFGVSATYHRVSWRSVRARLWMRRLDHSMIFLLIAGTYTPIDVIALHGTLALSILVAVWGLALLGIVLNLVWAHAPKWLMTAFYLALGWIAAGALPQLASAIGITALSLLLVGGACYSVGAIIYATKRPDPAPTVFGYHELFHVLTIVAAALQYAVIAFWIVPT
ncbi:MAG: PAQR family membrane homeostasis protein TrhA [Solirubrobacteraceae bacterium]|jgi:hemolysin III